MHVCIVTSRNPLAMQGGEEKFTVSLFNYLLRSGVEATIVGRGALGVVALKSSTRADLKIPKGKSTQSNRRFLPHLMAIPCMLVVSMWLALRILEANRESRMSLIHAQDTGYGGLSAVVAAKLLKVPLVISSHGVRFFTLRHSTRALPLAFEYWLDVFTSRNADLVIAVSEPSRAFFDDLHLKEKVVMIPIGIEVARWAMDEEAREEVRRELYVQNETLIGFVGRFSLEKNLYTLLKAFALLPEQEQRVKLMLIGTGPLDSKLRAFCHSEGLDNKVIFTGLRNDVGRLLSALDIFVLPSYTEGCPTALLEAMASGKAIIASNIPSVQSILQQGKEAILVNPNDTKKLEEAILMLHRDPELRKNLGSKAREKAKSYDVHKIYAQLRLVYEELLRAQCARYPPSLQKVAGW